MDKALSQQIADAQKDLLSVIDSYSVPQAVSFKIGQICGKLDMAHKEAVKQEDNYTNLVQLCVARNPDKLKSLIQNLSEIISGDNTDKEKEDVNDGRAEENLG